MLPILQKYKIKDSLNMVEPVEKDKVCIDDVDAGWSIVLPDLGTAKEVIKIPILSKSKTEDKTQGLVTLDFVLKSSEKYELRIKYDTIVDDKFIADECWYVDDLGGKCFVPDLSHYRVSRLGEFIYTGWINKNNYQYRMDYTRDWDYNLVIFLKKRVNDADCF